ASYESAPVMSFCSAEPAALLVPDRHFLKTQGYAEYRRIAAGCPNNWDQRNPTVLWRGNLTGGPKAADGSRPPGADKVALIPRLRMCQLLRDVPGTDVKIVTGKPSKNRMASEILARERVIGGYVPQADWVHHKFALDIDGYSNAWTNFYIRLVLGCCVIKVASQGGYRQ